MTSRRRFLATAAALAPLAKLAKAIPLAKFPLGVTTDEIDEDLKTALTFLREFGLEQAEIRNLWGKYNTAQPIEKIREARKMMDEYRVKTSILSTGFFKVPLPADKSAALDEQWALLDGAFDRADIMGVKKLRTFAFTYRAGEKPDPAVYPRIYELLREAAKRARARGFQLAVENVGESYVWSGEEAGRMLKAVKDDALGLTWDPNNAAVTGEKSYPDGYKQLDTARILHVHLRDFRRNANGKVEWCAVGEGEMDNLGQIRALLAAGYKGTWTLETHYRSPQGKAHATRTSLTALLKVVEKA
jgi:sugar phosphate isomerase/epimerase